MRTSSTGSGFWAIGDNTIDQYHGADEQRFVGGNALNVAVQLARGGASVAYGGAIGVDANGDVVSTALRAAGVSLEGLVVEPGSTATTDIRITPDGDRVFERESYGVVAGYAPSDSVLARAVHSDWIHLGMLFDAERVAERIAAIGGSALLSQDCAVSTGYAHLDVAFCSIGESEDPRAIAELAISGGARLAVVTRGAEGAMAFDGTSWWRQAALPVTVVDTTGAGDSFIAGFIAARASGADIAVSLVAGAAAAAVTCGHLGAWPQ